MKLRKLEKHLLFAVIFGFFQIASAEPNEKVSIGEIENILLTKWGISLPGRVDTGAAVSSLGASKVKILGDEVEVTLQNHFGGRILRIPIHKWRNYRTTTGTERRPVVKMEVCLGSHKIMADVNITRRADMEFPFLIGRNILKDRFLVDVDRAFSRQPRCDSGKGR